jgi:hypothetical protein
VSGLFFGREDAVEGFKLLFANLVEALMSMDATAVKNTLLPYILEMLAVGPPTRVLLFDLTRAANCN